MRPAKPPHAGVVTFFNYRFRALDPTAYLVRVQDTLEIEPDGAPEPDIAIVAFRADFYGERHPSGADAALIIEVGDTERKPREKMGDYMRDGRIPVAWRIDLPNRCVELWEPRSVGEPVAIRTGAESFGFAGVTCSVDEVFSTVLKR
jgi:Uma2 family endonuclease